MPDARGTGADRDCGAAAWLEGGGAIGDRCAGGGDAGPGGGDSAAGGGDGAAPKGDRAGDGACAWEDCIAGCGGESAWDAAGRGGDAPE